MKKITTEILCNFVECNRRGYFDLLEIPPKEPCEYDSILSAIGQAEIRKHINDIQFKLSLKVQPNMFISHDRFIANYDFLLKTNSNKIVEAPLFFFKRYKTKEYYLRAVAFFSIVQSMINQNPLNIGYIYNIDNKKLIRIKANTKRQEVLGAINNLCAISLSTPGPPVIWKKHCHCCDYSKDCFIIAKETCTISLLPCITPKLYSKWLKKGISTIDQLALCYRPRRRNKKRNPNAVYPHQPQLHALAIKENKVFVQVTPEILNSRQYFILDIEGDLNRNTFFLIGLLQINSDNETFINFWAGNSKEQIATYENFLQEVRKYPNIPIYHFGSFDEKVIHKFADQYQYDIEDILSRFINFSSVLHGKIYFPSFGHGLKDIAPIIGAKWTMQNPSGLNALILWHRWLENNDYDIKQQLLLYNREDCFALHNLIQFVSRLKTPNKTVNIDYIGRACLQSTEAGKILHGTFDNIVKYAHADYNRHKISFRGDNIPQSKISYEIRKRIFPVLHPNKIIYVRRRLKCPRCHRKINLPNKKKATAQVVDLTFGKQGCRRLVTKYIGSKIRCPICREYYSPVAIIDLLKNSQYGAGLVAWTINQRIVLRMPYSAICQSLSEMYAISMSKTTICNFIKSCAKLHEDTERNIISSLRTSSFVHVDETQINIEGINQYVWVFTNGNFVLFLKTETRDASIVLNTLNGFDGVLISDFFAGYDSMPWRQQKCLSHFIRDLNDDLWKEPNNKELEEFSCSIRQVLFPIFSDIEHHGLKKKFFTNIINLLIGFIKSS
ncbi:MAG TPA: hypothetical protein DD381_13525 [Lentisphaeria bacterium]|nr:MAG: hypothetical protein A2X47_09995 [Lentisphaerae bacterium GWF2_38_69]HBM17342.1 hypothetical protein [Lentisphaeria bacterium]